MIVTGQSALGGFCSTSGKRNRCQPANGSELGCPQIKVKQRLALRPRWVLGSSVSVWVGETVLWLQAEDPLQVSARKNARTYSRIRVPTEQARPLGRLQKRAEAWVGEGPSGTGPECLHWSPRVQSPSYKQPAPVSRRSGDAHVLRCLTTCTLLC